MHLLLPIAKNFRGRKLLRISKKYDFRGENFCGLLTFAAPKDTMPQNFAEKTFANSHKTTKFMKVFSLESFPLYGIRFCVCTDPPHKTLWRHMPPVPPWFYYYEYIHNYVYNTISIEHTDNYPQRFGL